MRVREIFAMIKEIDTRTDDFFFPQNTVEECKENLKAIREINEELYQEVQKLIKTKTLNR